MWKRLGIRNNPETSIGRALTNLTTLGYLVKMDGLEGRLFVQRKGRYGKKEFAWSLK
jgi:hypothetical protein